MKREFGQARLFQKGRSKPIDFGVGYQWRPGQSNLLLAVKRALAESKRGSHLRYCRQSGD
ncbi:MAG: hypothetical protein EXR03_06910 [Pseudolabrys sp.]|nr:hypothetical protein [Pseudolabrys sp.]MSP32534.1 hypothetical protein [Pseudolabrys sp.]